MVNASDPSDTRVANVSSSTTMREVLSIGNIPVQEFKLNNLNLMYGKVNHLDYLHNMMNFPTLLQLRDKISNLPS